MNRNKMNKAAFLFDEIGNIGDVYLQEALTYRKRRINTRPWIAAVACILAVVIVGSDPASQVYVRNKKRACEEVGFYSEEYALPEETSQEELLALVDKLNTDDRIHGICPGAGNSLLHIRRRNSCIFLGSWRRTWDPHTSPTGR